MTIVKFCAVNALLSLEVMSADVDEGEVVVLVTVVVQPTTAKEATTRKSTAIAPAIFSCILDRL